MIWEKEGKIITDGTGQVVDCDHCPCTPSAAPCTCPGTGLLSSYVVVVPEQVYPSGVYWPTGSAKWDAQDVIVDQVGSTCEWIGTLDIAYTEDDGATWTNTTVGVDLALSTIEPCAWVIQISMPSPITAGKTVGQTRVGDPDEYGGSLSVRDN